ncbi:YhdP family protein [Herbaspirillum sp. alder98]|uniref:YhdP family protein n=1 Tax=Herbaspirillum sp. alder98 TaxID=2913096 RepID=UPI001CD8DCF3|nr:YhdP family protein [Herbaspirillum sp. alder98]MCA1323280.1 TIGR02099 family protein [Herbaspirillum sp. alder98]
MQEEQRQAASKSPRWALCWRIARGSYFKLNRASHHVLGFTLKFLLVAYFVFCALFLGLRYAVLPEISHYKPQIERMASRAVGRAVTIEQVQASWSGLRPQLALANITVHDAQGQPALTLPRVNATLSWSSVLVAGLRLENLSIEQADLAIRRDSAGRLDVGGIPVPAGGDGSTLDWLLSQREIVIRASRVRWHDELRNAPELTLDDVNLVLHNSWLRHRLSLRAVPPGNIAAPLDVRADFTHPAFSRRISDVSRWKGTLYADLRQTDLSVWRAYVDYPFEILRGTGSVRAWLALDQAKVANFTADLGLSDFSARLSRQLEPLTLKRVNGRISASEILGASPVEGVPTFGANGHKVSLTDFSIEMPDGFVLPATSLDESYEAATPLKPERTSVKASHLNLEALSQLAARLPLAPSQRKLLDDLAPRGDLHDFTVQWQGTYPELSSYRIQGRFSQLGLKAQSSHVSSSVARERKLTAQQSAPAQWAALPGFDNLSGSIDATEKGGTLRLDARDFGVQLPAQMFAESRMPFDRLTMDAHWQYQKDQTLLFEVDDLDFAQPGVAGRLRGKHIKPLQGTAPGTVDVTGEFSTFDIKTLRRYLPQHMNEGARHWLTEGLVDGTARNVQLRIKGDLADLPFQPLKEGDKPRGELTVNGDFDGLKVNYTPGHLDRDGSSPEWPLLEEGRGKFSLDRARLEIKADSARSLGARLGPVTARVAELVSHDAALEIDGVANAPMPVFLQYVNHSPVARWTGDVMQQSSASGDGRLELRFRMPLNHAIDTTVQGAFHFAGNDVDLLPTLPVFYRTGGKVEFNEHGFTLNGVRGQFLGDNVALSGGTQRDGSSLVRLDGAINIEMLRRQYSEPSMQRLLARMEGGARYSATVQVRGHRPELVVESNLAGLAVNLPAPLNKAAGDNLPMRFDLQPVASSDPLVEREEIRVALGSAIASRYLRERVVARAGDWRVTSGGIGYGQPVPTPAAGLKLALATERLDLDAWRDFKSEIEGQDAGAGGNGNRLASSDITQYLQPDAVSARVGALTLMGKQLDGLILNATHQKNAWQINLESQQASGTITWEEPGGRRGPGKVSAQLSSLVIPKGHEPAAASTATATGGATADNNAQMPALDIRAERFELAGKKLGRLELAANNMVTAVGREWRIERLLLSSADAELRAAGNWMAFGRNNTTNVTYALDIHDAGKLLERFGYSGTIRGGQGKLDGDLSWKGLPYALDIPSLSGQVHLDVHAGQFLKVDPGAAKLLGVLNLQALPRRLTLDFRDVFSEGFAFDNVLGTAAIKGGIATTDNLKMTGVTASVLMNGSADINRETQDLHVVVIPEINLGTASVVAMAVNPVIGVSTLLAQLFLRSPVMKSLTFEYKVSGAWSDPVVVKQGQVAPVDGERARELLDGKRSGPAAPAKTVPAAPRREIGPIPNAGA